VPKAGEVLGCCGDAVSLLAADEGVAELAGQVRVLAAHPLDAAEAQLVRQG